MDVLVGWLYSNMGPAERAGTVRKAKLPPPSSQSKYLVVRWGQP